MILLPLLLLIQSAPLPAAPKDTTEARFGRCADLAVNDPDRGEAEASTWRLSGGGFLAQQCLGMAHATRGNYTAAAAAFEEAARGAEVKKDARAGNYWAQAGNAWLAAGEAGKARQGLDAAIASGTLTGLPLGEAHLDRARALVAQNDLTAARTSIDHALETASDDPLAWLLSATLARRMNDLPRARTDIAKAVERAGDDASVQLEAGNIAALSGDEAGARGGWNRAASIGGSTPIGEMARAALAQFDAGK